MKRLHTVISLVALSALATACSGGSETSEPAPETTAEATPAETPAEPAMAEPEPAAAPAIAADDTTTTDGVDFASLKGDAAAGKETFGQCATCHSTEAGKNRAGPSLAAIVGRKAASIEGFAYSDAMKASGITWSEAKIAQFIENPARVVPDTQMYFQGLSDAQERANVVAYLKNPS